MKRWLCLLSLMISSFCVLSQKRVINDTSTIQSRSFNSNAIQDLKTKKEFQYTRTKEPALSLWDKFWNWVWWKAGQLLKTKGGRTTAWSLLILLAIVVIVFFVAKLTGMDKNGLFGRGAGGAQKYSLSHNDIHTILFDEEIEKAIRDGDYRLATRLYYLQALKKLSDKGFIDWQINKTNSDYLAEITGRPFTGIFTSLTNNFEYTWYGEKYVNREQFAEIKQQFEQFNYKLQ